jgi:hypothetical protein
MRTAGGKEIVSCVTRPSAVCRRTEPAQYKQGAVIKAMAQHLIRLRMSEGYHKSCRLGLSEEDTPGFPELPQNN